MHILHDDGVHGAQLLSIGYGLGDEVLVFAGGQYLGRRVLQKIAELLAQRFLVIDIRALKRRTDRPLRTCAHYQA